MRSSVRHRSLLERAAAAPHVVWAILFIVAPLLFVIYFAMTDAEGNITLKNLASLADYSNIFLLSVSFAFIAAYLPAIRLSARIFYVKGKQAGPAGAAFDTHAPDVDQPAYPHIFAHGPA